MPIDTQDQTRLVTTAKQVRHQAYAPYSHFLVGAAILDSQGAIFSGCNVENASLGLTICAERVAASNAVAHGSRGWRAIAVVSRGGAAPCGACRQVLYEFASDLAVLLIDADEPDRVPQVTTLSELLPQAFEGP